MEHLNDLQLLDQFCETCLDFINPKIFREIEARGLYCIVNNLPGNVQEAKAVVRCRLAKIGRCYWDDEIDQIAHEIYRLEELRKKLNSISLTEVQETLPILDEMQFISQFVRDYYKQTYIS